MDVNGHPGLPDYVQKRAQSQAIKIRAFGKAGKAMLKRPL